MENESIAIMLGWIAAVVLTPLLATLWQSTFPSPPRRGAHLSDEAWREGSAIETESFIATVVTVALFGVAIGFATRIDVTIGGVLIGSFVAVPTAYVFVRTTIKGHGARARFISYFEVKHRVSFRSWLAVSAIGALAAIVGVIRLVVRSAT